MYKWIIACVTAVALSGYLVFDYMSFKNHDVIEVASIQEPRELAVPVADKGTYLNHLLSKVGLGEKIAPTEESTLQARVALRAADLNSFLPTPDAEEGVLAEWERLKWDDSYQAAFGWPDGMDENSSPQERLQHASESALFLKGGNSVYVRIEYAEPTEMLAKRLKQSYWVIETGRDLERLKQGRPRASYFWTNIKETSAGYGVKYAKDVDFFETYDGVHFLKAKNKKDRRDVETRYYFASLGSGVVIKVRALASKKMVKEILAEINYESLNLMQTLPNPLIAGGLDQFILETPQNWLVAHGYEPTEQAVDAEEAQHKAAEASTD